MKLEALAVKVLDAAEEAGAQFMAVGAIAAGAYGVPRSTRDVDVLIEVPAAGREVERIAAILQPLVEFDPQIHFDGLTWGRRHVGRSREAPPYKVELFEVFDDPFVHSEFARRRAVFVPMLERAVWLPSPEDVVVQKLRWGRNKDLDDARDVLAVQGPETLDMAYIETWCAQHGTLPRLREALASIPPL